MIKAIWRALSRLLGFRSRTESLLSLDLQGRPPERVQPAKSLSPRETDAILGLDFGTSCTKVVIRTPYLPGGEAYAIPFDGFAHKSSRYLLPTCLSANSDRSVFLPTQPVSPNGWGRSMKYRLFLDPSDLEAAAEAAAYLTLVLRLAKTTYLRYQTTRLPHHMFKWHLNLGIPSAGYDDQRKRAAFRRVAEVASAMSEQAGPVSLASARHLVSTSSVDRNADHINVFPEIAVEAVGYARSPYRSNGLHLLIDVGATTLDACAFILHEKEGDDRYSLLTAVVEPLGVHRLHERRITAVERYMGMPSIPESIRSLDLGDPLALVPEGIEQYLSRRHALPADIGQVDALFCDECDDAIRRVVHNVRHRKDPYSPHWKAGLPVFLAGGGAGMGLYREALDRVSERSCRIYNGVARFRVDLLPNMGGLSNQDLGDGIVRRLGVAYGLSFHALEIGSIEPPSEAPAIEPMSIRAPVPVIGKEQI